MRPITRHDEFFEFHVSRLVEEQMKTNELLQQLLDTLKQPVKEVEQVERNGNDKPVKRKR